MTEPISRRAAIATGAASAAALLTGCAGVVPVGNPAAAVPREPTDLALMMEVAGVPGVAVAVVRGSEVSVNGYGVTRAGEGRAVNGDTVFEAASLSKPVFAWLVLALVREGLLDLDRPVRQYMPLPTTDARSAGITARHLLSHSGGWRNWRNAPAHTLTTDFDPGSRFGYSGEGFYFLSRVVEKVTGRGILRLTQERVFTPLGMTRTSYIWSPALDANRAEPHSSRGVPGNSFGVRVGKALREAAASAGTGMDHWTHEQAERMLPAADRELPVLPNFLLPNVAGSLLTSATDYARFMMQLLVDRSITPWMLEPQVTMNSRLQWGLGAGIQKQGAKRELWHWGDTFGFRNFMVASPADRSAMAVFTNGQNGRAIYERLIRRERGDQPAFLWI